MNKSLKIIKKDPNKILNMFFLFTKNNIYSRNF